MSETSTPVCIGPASPDAGVELLRQLFLQCGLSLWTVKSNKKKERKPRYDTGQNHGLIKPWCYPGFNKLLMGPCIPPQKKKW